MKVLCDQMLGSLATWLRFLGVDTYYATDEQSDDELLEVAQKEKRMLLTRDKELIIRAHSRNLPVIPIEDDDLDTQLELVVSKIQIDESLILTRCALCNTPLQQVEKDKVQHKVPEKVFENHTLFWRCPQCNKFYWKGTHFEKIQQKIKQLLKEKESL